MTVDSAERVDSFVADWEQWHHHLETWLADPHGFLAITSLHWLSPEPQRFDDAAGSWCSGIEGVTVRLDDGEELIVDDEVVTGTHHFGIIPERGGITALWGDVALEVAKRGGHDILRPRHPDNPLRVAYRGTPAFPPDPRWVVTGHYEAFETPRPTTVGAAVDGLTHVYDATGSIAFELDGHALALTTFPGHRPGTLTALFTDATSGTTTYGAVRSVSVDAPDADGAVTLDFNRAANLPCAYTDLATCPLPPAENRLAVAIEAGEQTPYERGT